MREEQPMRAIGVDLHTTQITVCYLAEDGTSVTKSYQLNELEKFRQHLSASDEARRRARLATRAGRVQQVHAQVQRVVIVNPRQFEVIRQSVKKTDAFDAESLAQFLRANLLPEVRAKSEECERVQSLVQTREKLVRLRTTLINKVHGMIVARGRWRASASG